VLKELREVHEPDRPVVRLPNRVADDRLACALVGSSALMERLRKDVQRVALSDKPVLVTGPSGAGKEPVVRAIHAWGANADQPFVPINCSAIPESLFESELFGYERGAFTGAERRRDGYLLAAGKGTLFLDEVADLPGPLQAKLLRVLECGRFRPVGISEERLFVGRVVAATNVDLTGRVKEGRFREDLLYRLDVLPLRVPALRERREDIPLLVGHFAQQQPRRLRFSPEAMKVLAGWSWPGNVRQLRTVVQRLAVFCEDDLVLPGSLAGLSDLGEDGVSPATAPGADLASLVERILDLPMGAVDRLQVVEDALVAVAMRRAGHVKARAASLLGVNRKRVERRTERGPRETEETT
jgi:DNA-binding NtrC family response regulator